MWCGSLLWHSNRFCALVQLLRWLVDSDMAGLWTAGRQVSSCTYCKLCHKTLREKIIVLIFFLNLYTSYKVTGWHADLHTCLKSAKIAHYVMLHNRPCFYMACRWFFFYILMCSFSFFLTSGCQATLLSMMKLMTMIMKTTTRTCSERSWQAITSLTLRTGMTSLIQVLMG